MSITSIGHLSRDQVSNAVNAFAYAEQTNRPLNIPVNINWLPGSTPEQVIRFQHRFFKLAGQWLDYHAIPKAWMWAMEYPEYRLHSHLNMHLPDDREVYAAFRKLAKSEWVPAGTDVQFSKNNAGVTQIMSRLDNRQRRCKYLLKSMGLVQTAPASTGEPVNLAQAFGIVDLIVRKGDQGHLPVKRLGVSRSIDRSARSAAGYVDTCNPLAWASILDDTDPAADDEQVAA